MKFAARIEYYVSSIISMKLNVDDDTFIYNCDSQIVHSRQSFILLFFQRVSLEIHGNIIDLSA